MHIIIGSDERNYLTDSIVEQLRSRDFEVTLVGPLAEVDASWPTVARQVAEGVAQGQADEGILCCWTGTGVSIAANKVPGIRAALCDDAETARGARLWNNANVLCLSLRRTSEVIAHEILEAWYKTSYQANPEDDACLAAVDELEQDYFQSQVKQDREEASNLL
ncbi:MAG: RpiB/LacA/LacB family sugar-phosphate isomerase [Anaerolineales bacterium]|nr:RpiB/LacA/LacB family sugar-phosphate isomerase [Anaerolineales bacterium]